MKVTVNICTWNRCDLLRQALAAMTKLAIPPTVEWELQVVNNACTDGTDGVLAEFSERLPLQRLYEPAAGKSRALNLGLSVARGDLILFTDDDALVPANWLQEYTSAAATWPEAGFFGGPVEPWFAEEPPAWIRQNIDKLQGPYAIRNSRGGIHRIASHKETPYGVNMAIRRRCLSRLQFRVDLGPTGKSQVRGEETALLKELEAAGEYGVWVGTAPVQHYIPPERLTREYIVSYYRGLGEVSARMQNGGDYARLFGIPRYALRQAIYSDAKRLLLSPVRSGGWVEALKRSARAWGFIAGSRQQSRQTS